MRPRTFSGSEESREIISFKKVCKSCWILNWQKLRVVQTNTFCFCTLEHCNKVTSIAWVRLGPLLVCPVNSRASLVLGACSWGFSPVVHPSPVTRHLGDSSVNAHSLTTCHLGLWPKGLKTSWCIVGMIFVTTLREMGGNGRWIKPHIWECQTSS